MSTAGNVRRIDGIDFYDKAQYKDITYIAKYYQIFTYLEIWPEHHPAWHFTVSNRTYDICSSCYNLHCSIILDMCTRYI